MRFNNVIILYDRYEEKEIIGRFLTNAHETSVLGKPLIICENSNYKNIVLAFYREIVGKSLWPGSISSLNGLSRLRDRSRNTPVNIFLSELTTLNRMPDIEFLAHFEEVNVLINATYVDFEREVSENVEQGLNWFTHGLLKHMEFID